MYQTKNISVPETEGLREALAKHAHIHVPLNESDITFEKGDDVDLYVGDDDFPTHCEVVDVSEDSVIVVLEPKFTVILNTGNGGWTQ